MLPLPDKKKVILFIDDEKVCHILAELIIPNFTNYRLIGAYTGKEAIMLAKRYAKQLSLVLSDIMLPDMNGHDIQTTLSSDPRLSNVPFIFQSGIEKEEKKGKEKGQYPVIDENKIIYKPYQQEELLDFIERFALEDN